jgi:hypothetical protein
MVWIFSNAEESVNGIPHCSPFVFLEYDEETGLLPPGITFEQIYQVACCNACVSHAISLIFELAPAAPHWLASSAAEDCIRLFLHMVSVLQVGICIELNISEGGYECDCLRGFKKENSTYNPQDESPCIGERPEVSMFVSLTAVASWIPGPLDQLPSTQELLFQFG